MTDIRLDAGESAPDFTLKTLDGERQVRLSDERGNRVLLFFIREFS